MSKVDLKLGWCSHAAAKYAVEHWHYSKSMPAGKLVKVGVWEEGGFVGCVLFGLGANNQIGSPYGLAQTETCELVRIALTRHVAPVSRIASIAIKLLQDFCPGLRLLVSYADPQQGHHGGIYQAMGWVYVGDTTSDREVYFRGRWMHPRTVNSIRGTQVGLASRPTIGKHKYIYPLDAEMRAKILPLAKPYPKRAGSIAANAPAIHAGEGGATPTPALQTHQAESAESV